MLLHIRLDTRYLESLEEDMSAWTKKYLKPLVGRKIVKVGVNKEEFPVIYLDDGTKLEISQDEEGNGPGFIFGLPYPK